MKALFLCLALAALPAFGEHQETSLAPIALYIQFPPPPPAVFNALQDEVSSIMAPAGLRFAWRFLPDARRSQGWVELAVITFAGRCDVAALNPDSSVRGPLGWTEISDGVILPFAEVDCQSVRDFIQRALLRTPAESREATYGRALGRVLAHELYHIFANTTSHSSRGVGKSKFTVQDLVSPEFQFEGQESHTLKGSKAYAALQWAAFGR